MARKLYWGVGLLSLLVSAVLFFLPGEHDAEGGLPWQIEHPAPGVTRIFGLTLGGSAAGEAEQRFRGAGKLGLFRSPDGRLAAEMFFDQVAPAGLKARVAVAISVSEAELQGMYERGLRISGTGSGRKITPSPDDADRLRALPVGSLTYMPSIRLEEEILLKRFGQPERRIRERKNGVVHWLYPRHGLDIALGGEEKPVLQYVPPGDFDRLLQPLLDGEEISESQRG